MAAGELQAFKTPDRKIITAGALALINEEFLKAEKAGPPTRRHKVDGRPIEQLADMNHARVHGKILSGPDSAGNRRRVR